MLPRWHVIYGAIFTGIIWLLTSGVEWYNLVLLFLASFLIDFDHYAAFVIRTGKIGLFESFKFYDEDGRKTRAENARGIRQRGVLMAFHTIEFIALIGIIGIWFIPFFYIFVGMVFHSLLDIYAMGTEGYLYRREFFFYKWIGRKFKNSY